MRSAEPYHAAAMADEPSDDARGGGRRGGDLLDTPDAGPAAIRGGVVRMVGYGAGVVLSIGSAALLFRHLGVEDGGRYVTVLALISIVAGLTDVGLTSIGVRELAVREGPDRDRVLRSVIGLRIALTSAGVAVAVLFAMVAGYSDVLVIGTLLAGVGLIVQNVQTTLSIPLLVDLRLGWVTALDLVRQVVTVSAIVALVLTGATLLPFFAIPVPAAFVALALTVLLVRRDIPVLPSFDRAEWVVLVRDVLPFAAATAIASIYFRLAIVMLSLISTARQTGYFGAAFRVVEVLVVVPQLVVQGAFPIFARAARDDHARLAYAVQRTFEACAVLGGALAVSLVLGAEFVIEVVAGPEFGPAADVLRIQALTVLVVFAAVPWSYAMLSLRRHRAILAVTLLALTLNAALVAILGSAYGAEGAAVGTLLADAASFVASGIYLAWKAPAMRPQVGVLARIGLALAAAAVLMVVPGLTPALRMAIGTAVYAIAALAVRAIPPELFVELRRLRSVAS